MMVGYITMSTKDFAKSMNLSLTTLRKCEKSLMEKGLLMKDRIRNEEGKLITIRTIFMPEPSTHPEDEEILKKVAKINKEKEAKLNKEEP